MRLFRSPLAIFTVLAIAAPGVGFAQTSPSATPSPTPTIPFNYREPGASTAAGTRLIYVFAIGLDPSTRQKVVATLARELQYNQYQIGKADSTLIASPAKIVPEPDWGVPDYLNSCQPPDSKNPQNLTAGAVIAGLDSSAAFSETAYVYRTNVSEIRGTLLYSLCKYGQLPATGAMATPLPTRKPAAPPKPRTIAVAARKPKAAAGVAAPPQGFKVTKETQVSRAGALTTIVHFKPTPSPTPPATPAPYSIVYSSDVHLGRGSYWFPTLLPILGLLGAAVAAWTAFTPSVTKSTVNTFVFPTPQPIPPAGSVSQSVTTNSKTTNASQLTGVATSFLGSTLTYDTAQTGITTTDRTTLDALNVIVGQFMDDLGCPLKDPAPNPSPTPLTIASLHLPKDHAKCTSMLGGTW